MVDSSNNNAFSTTPLADASQAAQGATNVCTLDTHLATLAQYMMVRPILSFPCSCVYILAFNIYRYKLTRVCRFSFRSIITSFTSICHQKDFSSHKDHPILKPSE